MKNQNTAGPTVKRYSSWYDRIELSFAEYGVICASVPISLF
ncbi:hypothetical protein [Lacticaseibacillus rhamnosus]|nr:hypothetical protein [Lacticaseibacillus rhamnosus]